MGISRLFFLVNLSVIPFWKFQNYIVYIKVTFKFTVWQSDVRKNPTLYQKKAYFFTFKQMPSAQGYCQKIILLYRNRGLLQFLWRFTVIVSHHRFLDCSVKTKVVVHTFVCLQYSGAFAQTSGDENSGDNQINTAHLQN